MAIVTILLCCTIGAFTGLFQFVFLGASVGQALLAYGSISVLLPVAIIGSGLVLARLRPVAEGPDRSRNDVLECWQDWQTEEAMEADRTRNAADRRLDGHDRTRHSTSSPTLATRPVAATAYSARRAGKA